MLMTEIAAAWTAATNLLVRIVERSVHTVCLLLVGALIGAWVLHLNEAPKVEMALSAEREIARNALSRVDQLDTQRAALDVCKRLNLALIAQTRCKPK